MLKRKPTYPAKRAQRTTLVARLYYDALKQRSALTHPRSDKEMNDGLQVLASITANIAGTAAESATDVRLKLEVLCSRLREHLHPENAGELLSYLLADSIRDDLAMASVSAESGTEKS